MIFFFSSIKYSKFKKIGKNPSIPSLCNRYEQSLNYKNNYRNVKIEILCLS